MRLFALSIFQIFSSLYVFQSLKDFGIGTSQALSFAALIFSLSFLMHAAALAPAVWLISKKGLKFAVLWGNMFLILALFLLYLGRFDPIFFIMSAIVSGLEIGLYWTAHHIYFAELTDDKKQGEELSLGMVLSSIATVGGPAFGGLIITYGGFKSVFLVMAILVFLAIFPLKYLPKSRDTVAIDTLKIMRALNPKKEFKSYLGIAGWTVPETAYGIFWPIFVFPILLGFSGLGFLGSLVALISGIFTLAIGFLIDRFGPKRVMSIASPIDSVLWVVKSLVVTPVQIFVVSSIRGLTMPALTASLESLIYERARHDNLVAFIVQREMGIAVSRFVFLFVTGLLFWFGLELKYVFLISAIFVLVIRFYPTPKKIDTN